MQKHIIFFTLGTPQNGMGHIVRCITLADQLKQRGAHVEFVTLQNTPGWTRLMQTQHPVRGVAEVGDMLTAYTGHADAIVIDVEHGPDRAMLERARELYPCVINIGGVGWAMQDPDALDNLVDLQIYQSVLNDAPPNPRRLVGVEYMMINPAYAACMPDYERGQVVVSFGGSDPHKLTAPTVAALAGISRDCSAIIGGAAEFSDYSVGVRFVHSPPSIVGELVGASLSILQMGMTAYESLAAGVPCLLVNLSKDHERTSVELERLGCAINMGVWDEFNPQTLRERVEYLLARPDELRGMGALGAALVDGKGAARVADKVMEFVK